MISCRHELGYCQACQDFKPESPAATAAWLTRHGRPASKRRAVQKEAVTGQPDEVTGQTKQSKWKEKNVEKAREADRVSKARRRAARREGNGT